MQNFHQILQSYTSLTRRPLPSPSPVALSCRPLPSPSPFALTRGPRLTPSPVAWRWTQIRSRRPSTREAAPPCCLPGNHPPSPLPVAFLKSCTRQTERCQAPAAEAPVRFLRSVRDLPPSPLRIALPCGPRSSELPDELLTLF